jgi:tRNA-dihydrouridine synthase
MEGVGREGFVRTVNALHLTGCWMTPFLRLSETMPSDAVLRRFAAEYLNSNVPVTIQLMGNEPELLGRCGKRLLLLTAAENINLNCGCPSLRVVKHGAGGGMLKAPEKVASFCKRMAEHLPPGKLSVKLRAGFSSAEDMKIFLPMLAECGAVSKIFFHYRTVSEGYSPAALPYRIERISRAVKLCAPIPLIANGDISSVEDARELIGKTGAAGVMIARPWMRDPYLLRRFSADVPDAETGREKFFAVMKNHGISGGALIEAAKMLWGIKDPHFLNLLDTIKEQR